jgi:hypothetical protein
MTGRELLTALRVGMTYTALRCLATNRAGFLDTLLLIFSRLVVAGKEQSGTRRETASDNLSSTHAQPQQNSYATNLGRG